MNVFITHADKLLFRGPAITKGELVDYYRAMAPYLVSLVYHHPLVLQRFPQGIEKSGFFQKNCALFPPSLKRLIIPTATGKEVAYLLAEQEKALLYCVNLNTITFHAMPAHADHNLLPDRMIFDLDPSTPHQWLLIKKTAQQLRNSLQACGLESFVMTTGSRGLHVVAPLAPAADFTQVRAFALHIAQELCAADPAHLTTHSARNARGKRLLIDIMRNSLGATAVAPYAIRAKPRAPVATPLHWQELEDPYLRATTYTLRTIAQRLEKVGCPWQTSFFKAAKKLPT
jgi:bifunctional non-homologous end joining protein LigD